MGIYRSLETLAQDDVTIGAKGRAGIAVNPTARLNAQHERLLAAGAVGAGNRIYRYHDHCLDGGAVLGRGTIYSLDVGGVGNGGEIRHTLAAGSTWESMIGASTSREYIFPAYVTPGLTTTLACVLVALTFGNAIDIRITNLETGTSSTHASATTTSNAQQLAISDVPMSAGKYNRFDVEIKGSMGDALDLLALCLYEDTNTHPTTAGTTTYSAL